MKKILVAGSQLGIGGAEKVERDIALYADPQKYTVHFLIYRSTVDTYEQELLEKGFTCFHVPEPSENYLHFFRSVLRLMRQEKYHAVHVHTMFSSGWVMLAAKMAGVPVRICHAHSALDNGQGFVKAVYEAVMRVLILSCSTDLVACGVKAGQRLYGEKAFAKRGQLVLNGIAVESYAYRADRAAAIREKLGMEKSWIIGHTGHLAAVKNQSFLIELMPLILEKQPNARLLLLGEGPDRPMLEEKISQMVLQNVVVLTGNVTEVADYLSAMDVFAFPSLYEGLPLSVMEAQANGLPCVISDRVPEDVFLTDLVHALPLDGGAEPWVEALLRSARRDPARYNQALLNSEYTVQAAMDKIYRIYDKENF